MAKNLSPNFDKRPKGVKPSLIILHYTGMQSADAAFRRLCDPDAKVSAHYFIDEDGKTTQLVNDKDRAWHAGVAYWEGVTDVNAHSVGIEIVNPGHEFGYRPFPQAQMQGVAALCRKLIAAHGIAPWNILGHSDVAPERKEDPGELFDWMFLAEQGVGLWPAPDAEEMGKGAEIAREDYAVQRLLGKYGYNPLAPYEEQILAFHRHFRPEKFGSGADPRVIDATGAARLLSLIRLKNSRQA